MFEIDAIYLFSASALLGGGVCYVVRGILGERVRLRGRAGEEGEIERRWRVGWWLVALGVIFCLLGFGAGFLAGQVSWGTGRDRALALTAGLALPALSLLIIGIVGDRARGRRRCPRCWYDMSGAVLDGEGAACPECGRAVRGERDLLRPRRRKWAFVLMVLLVGVGAYLFGHAARIERAGWRGAIPTTVLVLGWEVLPDDLITERSVDGSLTERMATNRPGWGGIRPTSEGVAKPRLLKWLTERELVSPDGVGSLTRALTLRKQHQEFFGSVPEGMEKGVRDFLFAAPPPRDLATAEAMAEIAVFWDMQGWRLSAADQASILRRAVDGGTLEWWELNLLDGRAVDGETLTADLVFEALDAYWGNDQRHIIEQNAIRDGIGIHESLVDRALGMLRHQDPERRVVAVDALGTAWHFWSESEEPGADAVFERVRSAVLRALDDPSWDVVIQVVRTVWWREESLRPRLRAPVLRALTAPDAAVRTEAISVASSWFAEDPAVEDLIVAAMDDTDAGVRVQALRAVQRLYPERSGAQSRVVAALRSGAPGREELIGWAPMAPPPPEIAAVYAELLADPDLAVAEEAAQALERGLDGALDDLRFDGVAIPQHVVAIAQRVRAMREAGELDPVGGQRMLEYFRGKLYEVVERVLSDTPVVEGVSPAPGMPRVLPDYDAMRENGIRPPRP